MGRHGKVHTVKVWEGKGERGKLGNFIGTEEARTLKTTTRDMEPFFQIEWFDSFHKFLLFTFII